MKIWMFQYNKYLKKGNNKNSHYFLIQVLNLDFKYNKKINLFNCFLYVQANMFFIFITFLVER